MTTPLFPTASFAFRPIADTRGRFSDFALNPISMNERGQVAVRVKLADECQTIVRADPLW